MTTIFICATQFQILSTLSICKQEQITEATLILTNNIEKIYGWVPLLKKSNFFNSILIFPEKLPYQKRRHFLLLKRKLQTPTLIERIEGLMDPRKVIARWLSNFNCLHGQSNIIPSKIERIFISSPMPNLWKFAEFIKIFVPNCKTFGFDEGMGSYLPNPFYEKINGIYLFQPQLCKTTIPKHKILPLDRPELSTIWNRAKEIFEISEAPPKALFFDQWLGMPWVHNKCKKFDWKKSSFIKLKLSILKEIKKQTKKTGATLYYAPHPLQDDEATKHFSSEGFSLVKTNKQLPFELILLCTECDYSNSTWSTIFSSAPIMPLLAFSKTQNYRIIMLYEMFKGESELSCFFKNNELIELFDSISSAFPGRFKVPKNFTDLKSILASR